MGQCADGDSLKRPECQDVAPLAMLYLFLSQRFQSSTSYFASQLLQTISTPAVDITPSHKSYTNCDEGFGMEVPSLLSSRQSPPQSQLPTKKDAGRAAIRAGAIAHTEVAPPLKSRQATSPQSVHVMAPKVRSGIDTR